VKRLALLFFLTVLIAGRSAIAATPDTQGEFWPSFRNNLVTGGMGILVLISISH